LPRVSPIPLILCLAPISLPTLSLGPPHQAVNHFKQGTFLGSLIPPNWEFIALTVVSGNLSYTSTQEQANLQLYRTEELRSYICQDNENVCAAIFSNRSVTQLMALYSIISTCVVIVLLAFGGMFFSHDAHVLVIQVRCVGLVDDRERKSIHKPFNFGKG
jgi:hypothetical protein